MAPGLMDFANKLMGGNYQRGGSTAGANGGASMGGLLGGGQQGGQQAPQSMQGGLFQVPQGQSYGKIDWAAQNPFTNALD